mmetsp:Transcript_29821/g.34174  ORF Transcript_29821/g.34174 Transcript_29821/m.34174 type:complete len:127 (-) Transcript_29821:22-402(-)
MGKRLQSIQRQHQLYEQGFTKLKHELDCVAIVNSIRELKVLVRCMLDQHQKSLAKFCNDRLLSLSPDQQKLNAYRAGQGQEDSIEVPLEDSRDEFKVRAFESRISELASHLQAEAKSEVNQRLILM